MNITNIQEAVATVSKKTFENRTFKLFGDFKTPTTIQLKEKSDLSAEAILELLKADDSKFYEQESADEKNYWVLINNSKIIGNVWINVDEPNAEMLKEIVSKTELLAEV